MCIPDAWANARTNDRNRNGALRMRRNATLREPNTTLRIAMAAFLLVRLRQAMALSTLMVSRM